MQNAGRTGWRIERLLVAVVLLAAGALRGSLPQPTIGSWVPGASLGAARSGAAAVLLADGRVLVIGGSDAGGPVGTVEVIGTDGSVSAAAPMQVPRSHFVAARLSDGRVLVAGGVTTGSGITNAAELYDPATNTWTAVPGGMLEARADAAAVTLFDGRVLVAGGRGNGTVSNTLEAYDPAASGFVLLGTLATARTGAAAEQLDDGRVLIAGGTDAGGTVLASSELYDPASGTVSAGPAMQSARTAFTLTRLLNGRVLAAGGSDGQRELASLELYDPATNSFAAPATAAGQPVTLVAARQGHQAVRLPHNGAVLLFGGTAGGTALASAELFTAAVAADGSWSYGETATGALTVARAGAAAAALDDGTPAGTNPGLLVAAGGTDAGGNLLASTEYYGFPTVRTDQSDYAPGSTVTITGTGWQPGETVTLTLVESPLVDTHPVLTAVADAAGNIVNTQFVTNALDAGVTFYLTALGQSSGRQAQTVFSDASIQGAAITIKDATCTNPKTSFVIGDTVCASVLATVTGSGNLPDYYIVWFRPDNTAAKTTHETGVGNNTTQTDTLTLTGSFAVTGTWTVKTCKNSTCTGGGNVLDTKTFNVSAQPPSMSKSFGAAKIAVGNTTTLSFSLSNPNPSGVTLTGVSFTDTLPTGLVVATPSGLNNTCGGTATATAGSGSVSLSGASLAGGASCTVTVNVEANGAATGTLTNSVTVSSANGGTGNTATAQITVYQQYTVTFAATGIPTGSSADTSGTLVSYSGTQLGSPVSGTLTAAQLGTAAASIAFDAGTQVTFSYISPISPTGSTTKRYVLTAASPNPSPASPISSLASNTTVTASYVAQYLVTFSASGLGSDATGTVVSWSGTQAGSAASGSLTAAQLGTPAAQIWFDANTQVSYSYSSPVASSVTGKRYILDSSISPNPSPASPINSLGAATPVTATYKTQYQVTFTLSGVGSDVGNTTTVLTLTSPSSQSISFGQFSSNSYSDWFDAGSNLSYSFASPLASTTSGKRYLLTSTSPASISSLSAATTVTATYKAQYDTTTTVTSSANPSVYGQPVTFTATVATVASGGPTPTGSVQFSVDGSPSGSPVALSGGQAAVTISSLAVGGHTIAASYTPDTDSFTGSSGTLSQTVNKANTTTTVTSSANPSLLGQPVTFTATVSVVAPGAGTPTGSVSFYDGATLLGTVSLGGNQAQFTTSTLGVGSHNITASYSGDGNFNGSTSPALVQQVNYGFLGLQSPYAPPPATFNVKRTMPLKWQYTDNNGNVVNSSTANPQVIIYGPYTCGQPDTAGTITVNDAGSSGYQYDPTTNTWQFNWQVKGNLTGCYDIYIKSQQSGQQNGPFPISVVNK